jgi:nucleoside-diphosphate-sugar epimerase
MRVLLTGHHGYLGSVTGPVLAAAGHDVVGVDTRFYDGCDLYPTERPTEELRTDIRDLKPDDLGTFDAVVHLAALSNDPLGDFDPDLTAEINYEATVELARSARDAGVQRFVFASSCSMYGAQDGAGAVDEQGSLQPLTAYSQSKVDAELALRDLATESFSPILMRNATAYGASPRLRLDIVLNNLVAWAVTTGKVKILSDGTPWRPIVHVEDIARATVALLDAPQEVVHNEAFNVGGADENYQVRDLAAVVAETTGCDIEFAGSGDPDPRSYKVDFRKLAEALPDLSIEWNARRGAVELVDAYRAAELTLEDFNGDRFVRLRRLRSLRESGLLDERLRWQRHEVGA